MQKEIEEKNKGELDEIRTGINKVYDEIKEKIESNVNKQDIKLIESNLELQITSQINNIKTYMETKFNDEIKQFITEMNMDMVELYSQKFEEIEAKLDKFKMELKIDGK